MAPLRAGGQAPFHEQPPRVALIQVSAAPPRARPRARGVSITCAWGGPGHADSDRRSRSLTSARAAPWRRLPRIRPGVGPRRESTVRVREHPRREEIHQLAILRRPALERSNQSSAGGDPDIVDHHSGPSSTRERIGRSHPPGIIAGRAEEIRPAGTPGFSSDAVPGEPRGRTAAGGARSGSRPRCPGACGVLRRPETRRAGGIAGQAAMPRDERNGLIPQRVPTAPRSGGRLA